MPSDWVLIPAGVSLREHFNRLAPGRDKGADGSIGDSAHTSSSDHTPDEDSDVLRDHDGDDKNEVHAVDIDSTGPWPRPFAHLFMEVIEREQTRWFDPDDLCRLEYAIFNRKIYSRSNDFVARTYTGKNPHTDHAHFSFRYLTAAERDESPWGLEEDDVTKADFMAWMTEWAKTAAGRDALGDAVLERLLTAPEGSEDPDGKWYLQSFITNTYPAAVSARTYSSEARDAATRAAVTANQQGLAAQERLAVLESKLDALRALVENTHPGGQ